MKLRWSVLLTVLIFVACSEEKTNDQTTLIEEEDQSETFSLRQLKWLEGVWKDTTLYGFRNMTYLEDWRYYEDSLSGKGLSVEHGDTTITEQFAIRYVDKRLMYIARPVDQAVVGFPAIQTESNQLIFENKAHDFPSKITYQKQSADSLIITLNGIVLPQGERNMQFKLKKVSF